MNSKIIHVILMFFYRETFIKMMNQKIDDAFANIIECRTILQSHSYEPTKEQERFLNILRKTKKLDPTNLINFENGIRKAYNDWETITQTVAKISDEKLGNYDLRVSGVNISHKN